MENDRDDINEERKGVSSRADFIRWAGIDPELAEFVDTFVDQPEIFFSMPLAKRREIEHQMDALLSSFEQL
jgi:hypothetical protein